MRCSTWGSKRVWSLRGDWLIGFGCSGIPATAIRQQLPSYHHEKGVQKGRRKTIVRMKRVCFNVVGVMRRHRRRQKGIFDGMIRIACHDLKTNKSFSITWRASRPSSLQKHAPKPIIIKSWSKKSFGNFCCCLVGYMNNDGGSKSAILPSLAFFTL